LTETEQVRQKMIQSFVRTMI